MEFRVSTVAFVTGPSAHHPNAPRLLQEAIDAALSRVTVVDLGDGQFMEIKMDPCLVFIPASAIEDVPRGGTDPFL